MKRKGLFIGLTTIDFIYRLKAYPPSDTKILAEELGIFAGGMATNAAVTFSALGGEAHLVSSLGGHPVAALARDDLAAQSVTCTNLIHDVEFILPTAAILSVETSGERTAVSVPPSRKAPPFGVEHHALFDGAEVVLADGFNMEFCQESAAYARGRGIPVVLDAGSWKGDMENLLDKVDFAICSERFRPPGFDERASVLDYLLEVGVGLAAVSRGSGSIVYKTSAGAGEIPVPRVKAVDTLGAGDVLHGAFCYYLADGSDAVAALEKASRIASESCRYFGPRKWIEEY